MQWLGVSTHQAPSFSPSSSAVWYRRRARGYPGMLAEFMREPSMCVIWMDGWGSLMALMRSEGQLVRERDASFPQELRGFPLWQISEVVTSGRSRSHSCSRGVRSVRSHRVNKHAGTRQLGIAAIRRANNTTTPSICPRIAQN